MISAHRIEVLHTLLKKRRKVGISGRRLVLRREGEKIGVTNNIEPHLITHVIKTRHLRRISVGSNGIDVAVFHTLQRLPHLLSGSMVVAMLLVVDHPFEGDSTPVEL